MKEWELELQMVVESLKTRLEVLQNGGIFYIPKVALKPSDKKAQLKILRDKIGDCKRCELCSGRNNLVFGSGSPDAELMFIGEAPGAEEDREGEPFVGRSGQLLTKMIIAMGLSREAVYICNVVKCRPPDNRDPLPEEIAACEPFLKEQISIISPKVIVGLGRYACQTLLRSTTPIAKLRGIWHEYNGIKFMPTFHPAYLLRNPSAKKEVWEDLKAVMPELNGSSNTRVTT